MQVVGLTTALGTIQGTDTGTFAIGLVLSLVVSVYTLMLGTLFAQLGLTECFNIGEMAMQFVRECADKQMVATFDYPSFSCNRLNPCERHVAVLQVMYDASGVRLHAGKQATVLNIIISQLPADHPGSGETPLRDRLGHTPRQVQLQHAMVYLHVLPTNVLHRYSRTLTRVTW